MATAFWYWVLEGERQGPLRTDDLRQLLVTGRISSETLVWKQGMSEWLPASTVADFTPPPPPAVESPEPVAPAAPNEAELAPWGRRIAAKALDVLVIDLAARLGLQLLGWIGADIPAQDDPGFKPAVLLSFAFVYCVYHVVGESGRHRATLGKQLAGLQVIGVDGTTMGVGRVVVRALAQLTIFGFLLGPFHPLRQCAHDLLVGSLVIHRRPEPRDQGGP